MSVFSPNKTSAKLMIDFAHSEWRIDESDTGLEQQQRFLLVYDLYIKARSYALINKLAFWLSILAGIAILFWPSMAVIVGETSGSIEIWKSAIVQTSVTGLGALTFAVYSHYKKRQTSVENLMRHLIFAAQDHRELVQEVLREMQKIDAGFSFSEAVTKKQPASKDP